MIKKIIDFFEINYVFNSVVSFLLAVIVYLIFASKIEISYLVSVSLAVTGGIWSYLSIEQNKVKEVRGEYLRELKEAELSAIDYSVEASRVCDDILKIPVYAEQESSGKAPGPKKLHLLERKSELSRKKIVLSYRIKNVKNSDCNDKNFDRIEDLAKEMYDLVEGFCELIVKDKFNFKLYDEKHVRKINRGILDELNNAFMGSIVSFEEFSEDYSFKKTVCFSIISVCVYSVLIKAIVS